MIIVTAKVNRKKLALGAAAAGLLCAVAAVGLLGLRSTAAAALGGNTAAKTNEDRVAYLRGLGWEVSPDPVSVEELLIPEVLDEAYTQYLALQEEQGFDLTRYEGKRVKRYTYAVTNHPGGAQNVRASLLVFRGKIVGGDLAGTGVNGFLGSLQFPSA